MNSTAIGPHTAMRQSDIGGTTNDLQPHGGNVFAVLPNASKADAKIIMARHPHRNDAAAADLLRRQRVCSIRFKTMADLTREERWHPKPWELIGWRVDCLEEWDRDDAMRQIAHLGALPDRNDLIGMITQAALVTKHTIAESDWPVQISEYVRLLEVFPADITRQAFLDHAAGSVFFPTWAELKARIDRYHAARDRMVLAIWRAGE